jgi:hypothetical protein
MSAAESHALPSGVSYGIISAAFRNEIRPSLSSGHMIAKHGAASEGVFARALSRTLALLEADAREAPPASTSHTLAREDRPPKLAISRATGGPRLQRPEKPSSVFFHLSASQTAPVNFLSKTQRGSHAA